VGRLGYHEPRGTVFIERDLDVFGPDADADQ
jgi:hypothetical protein